MLRRVSAQADTSYIDLPASAAARVGANLPGWAGNLVDRITGITALERLRRAMPPFANPFEFANATLAGLRISCESDPEELARIPRLGRVLFVANHPFGVLDGLIAVSLLGASRPDLRLFANEELCALRELAPLFLPIEVQGPGRARRNAISMRRALRWLEHEGALLLFPAGEVSHFDARARCVTDPPWSRAVAMLAREARAPVVPVYFSGSNRWPYQAAGLVHPVLRALFTPRELCGQAGARVPVRIGAPLAVERLRSFASDEALAAHLRVTTYLLAGSRASPATSGDTATPRMPHPLAFAAASRDCAAEIERLPADCLLRQRPDYRVYCTPAAAIPNVLDEIGRLREQSARAAGAGTGRARDLDEFDPHYEHLFVWDPRRGQIAGACRLVRVDELRRTGRRVPGSSSRFRFRRPFFRLLGPALEIDRTFVCEEQGDEAATITQLWKGIGARLASSSEPLRILGVVDIGNHLRESSRQLLLEFLRSQRADLTMGALVRAAHPPPRLPQARTFAAETAMLGHLDALAALIGDIEPDGKGVPEQLRQFLELGGRLLSFGSDPQRGGVVQCLLMADLRRAAPRVLRRYLPESARLVIPR